MLRISYILALVALWVNVALPASASSAGPATLPTELRVALQENADHLSPLTISWSDSLSRQPRGEWDELARVSWQDGKIYSTVHPIKPQTSTDEEAAFDGKFLYSGSQGGVLVEELAQKSSRKPLFEARYFELAGVTFPTAPADLLAKRARSYVLTLLDSGGVLQSIEKVKVDGRPLVLIRIRIENETRKQALKETPDQAAREARTWAKAQQDVQRAVDNLVALQNLPPYLIETIYLGPALNYAVRRRDFRYEDGRLVRQCQNSDFFELENRGVWLPRRCVDNIFFNVDAIDGFRFSTTTPLLQRLIQVQQVTPSLVAGLKFSLDYKKPGTVIVDRRNPSHENSYIVPRSFQDLDVRAWYKRPRTIGTIVSATIFISLLAYGLFSRMKSLHGSSR